MRSSIVNREHNPSYRSDIDGLRAVAVLAVVLYHLFPSLISGGFVGVDIFFVISGFLISKILLKDLTENRFSFLKFYSRRICRIFPALLVACTAAYAIGWFTLLPDEFKSLSKHIIAGLAFFQNFVLLKESGYFDKATELKPLMHLWSLAVEEQFYVIYPFLLWGLWKLRCNLFRWICFLTLVSFLLNLYSVSSFQLQTFYEPQTRLWELLAGGLLAYGFLFNKSYLAQLLSKLNKNLIASFGAVLLLASIFFLNKTFLYPGWPALIPVLATIFILSAPDGLINQKILSLPFLIFVGRISYPLYLWHWLLLSYAHIANIDPPSLLVRITLALLSFLLAWLTYTFIESPIRFGTWLRFKTAVLCSLALVIGAIALVTYFKNGLDFRLSAASRDIANYSYDHNTDARTAVCWIGEKFEFNAYGKECTDAEKTQFGRIAIWGDSHSARLYPGLKKFLGNPKIAQFTRDACPPVLDVRYEKCQLSNNYVIDQIEKNRYDAVVLFANWSYYDNECRANSSFTDHLIRTILRLKKSGTKRVFVLGPAVRWTQDLPKIVYQTWKEARFQGSPLERLKNGIYEATQICDQNLHQILAPLNITYLSVYDIQCNSEGCLTGYRANPLSFYYWDTGHLTTDGAYFVAKSLFNLK